MFNVHAMESIQNGFMMCFSVIGVNKLKHDDSAEFFRRKGGIEWVVWTQMYPTGGWTMKRVAGGKCVSSP